MPSDRSIRVGDTVALNDHGLETLFGGALGLSPMKQLRMKVTEVEWVSGPPGKEVYAVEVDNDEINQFLICSLDVDIVERANAQ